MLLDVYEKFSNSDVICFDRLKRDVTRFGRHSQNDYFLDSTEYICLISRWHAEIHRVEDEGNVKFLLRDHGLNGTYVNDVRVSYSVFY